MNRRKKREGRKEVIKSKETLHSKGLNTHVVGVF